MSENGTPDIGRIINLIMENPKLIEEISNMAKKDAATQSPPEQTAPAVTETPQDEKTESVSASIPVSRPRSRRGELLTMLKPYLSSQRAAAIDSMVSVADILKTMRRGD